LFADTGSATVWGEGTQAYTMRSLCPDVAARVAEAIPSAKLLYVVRDPVRRLESNFRFMIRDGEVAPSVDINDALSQPFFMDRLVLRSKYQWQLEPWRECFPEDQIQITFFEDYLRDRPAALERIFHFLGVDPSFHSSGASEFVNSAKYQLRDSAVTATLRRIPGYVQLRDAIPARWLHAVERLLKRRTDISPPNLTPESRRWLIDQIEEDARAFLAANGKPPDFWDSLG
jgi:hypothetical protein